MEGIREKREEKKMSEKALSTRHLTEEEERHLTNLDAALENYYSAMRRAEKKEEKKEKKNG